MIFVDTSAWIFLVDDRQDSTLSKQAKRFANSCRSKFCTSDLVVAETHKWLVQKGRPKSLALQTLQLFVNQELAELLPIQEQDRAHALQIVAKYVDQKLSYVDALSIAQMRRTKTRQIFSFDKHFLLFPDIERLPN